MVMVMVQVMQGQQLLTPLCHTIHWLVEVKVKDHLCLQHGRPTLTLHCSVQPPSMMVTWNTSNWEML